MYKQYQLKTAMEFHLRIMINGEKEVISFTGGSQFPVVVRGKFATTDPKVAEALEKHSFFNVEYILVREDKPAKKKSVEVEGFQDVTGITTIQEAKDWLVQNVGADESVLNNKDRIMMAAESNKIHFVDLR